MTILNVTQAGVAIETDALTQGTPLPAIDKILIGAGPPAGDPTTATAMTDQWYVAEVLVVERLSEGAVKLHGEVPADTVGWIREIGLSLADGTLYAYAPYQDAVGGLYKASGFSFSFFVILSRETLPDLEFTYTPIDVPALTKQIADDARASMDVYLQSYLMRIVQTLSGLGRDVLRLRDDVRALKGTAEGATHES